MVQSSLLLVRIGAKLKSLQHKKLCMHSYCHFVDMKSPLDK